MCFERCEAWIKRTWRWWNVARTENSEVALGLGLGHEQSADSLDFRLLRKSSHIFELSLLQLSSIIAVPFGIRSTLEASHLM